MTPQHPRTPAAAATPGPRTGNWDEFACDGQKCSCHDPFLCSTCGCLHNEPEAQARPAVASEGLRAALDHLREHVTVNEWDQLNISQWCAANPPPDPDGIVIVPDDYGHVIAAFRAALASDAGSVGALDSDWLRHLFIERGWSIEMQDTGDQPLDPFAAIAAAYAATTPGDAPAGAERDSRADETSD